MSKNYKKKTEIIEEPKEKDNELSKKEQYDLKKKQKLAEKEKQQKKKKTKQKKTYQTNLAGRIFAIIMLILMVGSIIATIATYIR